MTNDEFSSGVHRHLRRKAIPAAARMYEPAISTAVQVFRQPSRTNDSLSARLVEALRAQPSSVHHDIAVIVCHLLYHTGRRPVAVTPSRGFTYRVYRWDDGSDYDTARVTDSSDHRWGVEGLVELVGCEGKVEPAKGGAR